MNSNLSSTAKKFSFPLIVTLLGLVLVIIAQKTKQPPQFMYASLFLTLGGLVVLYFSAGSTLAKITTGISIVLGLSGVYIYYDITADVLEISRNQELDQKMDELIKQNLIDIKTSQIAYKDVHGSYAKDFDKLRDFIKNGKIKTAVKNGGVPNRRITAEERTIIYGAGDQRALDYNMTEEEAYILSKSSNPPADLSGFVRDTILTSFYETSFGSKSYLERRTKMGFPKFVVDSIFYVPGTKKQFKMTITDSVEYQGVKVQALIVEGSRRMASLKIDTLYSFGSKTSPALGFSWD